MRYKKLWNPRRGTQRMVVSMSNATPTIPIGRVQENDEEHDCLKHLTVCQCCSTQRYRTWTQAKNSTIKSTRQEVTFQGVHEQHRGQEQTSKDRVPRPTRKANRRPTRKEQQAVLLCEGDHTTSGYKRYHRNCNEGPSGSHRQCLPTKWSQHVKFYDSPGRSCV